MVNQYVWLGIAIGVFFVGIGLSYAIFANTYDPMTMKFRNQDLFDQMMSHNPMMTQQWMDSNMMQTQMQQMMQDPQFMQQMGQMMNDPEFQKQMIQHMENHDSFMHEMMQDYEMREHMMGHMMADTELMQNMGISMPMEPSMSSGMDSMMSGMSFNVDAPLTMPMIDGYYNGEKMFFVHTEVSDKKMADMMSMMINFPTVHVSDLTSMPQSEMSKVYVFTNGIPGSGPYGGGPFMFQIDVFDSVPGQMGYSQFRVPHLVTWNDDSTPRILTSEDEILQAEANGKLTIQKTDVVVNAPMMIWKSNGMEQRASIVERMFESMPGVNGEITNIDVDNYIVMMKLHSQNSMDMMGSGMMMP